MKNYYISIEEEKTIFHNAEIINIFWETRRELIEMVLPPGLKPASIPLVNAFIVNHPRSNKFPAYKEAGIFVLAEKDGVLGNFCIAMPIDNHEVMEEKNKIYNSPKKIANIEFQCNEEGITGSITRNGITFFRVEAEINNLLNDKNGEELLDKSISTGVPMYSFKYSKKLNTDEFEVSPVLFKQNVGIDRSFEKYAICHIQMEDSPNDPWSILEVENLIGGIYTKGNIEVGKGKDFCELKPSEFLTYSYTRCDWWL